MFRPFHSPTGSPHCQVSTANLLIFSECHPVSLASNYHWTKDSAFLSANFIRVHWHGLLCINASASQPESDTLQSALEKNSLLKSISRPASSQPTDTDQILHLPSALARTPLHLCISQPASLDPTNTEQDHHHLPSALVLTPLLSISRPASVRPEPTETFRAHWYQLFCHQASVLQQASCQ